MCYLVREKTEVQRDEVSFPNEIQLAEPRNQTQNS